MGFASGDARQQLLDALAEAIDEIGVALAAVGDAYEQLDDFSADKLEEELFRPIQHAYGRAKRTHAEFAQRHGLPGRTFAQPAPGAPSHGVKGFLDRAVQAASRAEVALSDLQDTLTEVEVSDPELRAGLAEVRTLLDGVAGRARRFVSLLGR